MIETDVAAGFQSVGQPVARRIARQAAQRDRLQRTLLVHGPAGAGKDAFVADLLALLFCTHDDRSRRPCNACRGCRDARARAHSDLVVGSPEEWRDRRSTGESIVAVARRWLLEAAGSPVVGERRVVLIERADRANEQIQNALLKALEEPGDRHMFILVADEPERLLPTIRSRSQSLRVGPVAREELTAHLVDRERLPADQADTLARLSGGLTGTAIALARNADLIAWRRRVQTELLTLVERGRADRFAAIRDLLDETVRAGVAPSSMDEPDPEAEGDGKRTPASVQRVAAGLLVEAWLGLARDLLVAAVGRPGLAPSGELAPELERLAAHIGPERLRPSIELLERIHDGLRQNAAPKLALEAAMLAWPMLPGRER